MKLIFLGKPAGTVQSGRHLAFIGRFLPSQPTMEMFHNKSGGIRAPLFSPTESLSFSAFKLIFGSEVGVQLQLFMEQIC